MSNIPASELLISHIRLLDQECKRLMESAISSEMLIRDISADNYGFDLNSMTFVERPTQK